jgi:hypothetical protein
MSVLLLTVLQTARAAGPDYFLYQVPLPLAPRSGTDRDCLIAQVNLAVQRMTVAGQLGTNDVPCAVFGSTADRNFEPPFCGLAAPAALKSDCVKAAAPKRRLRHVVTAVQRANAPDARVRPRRARHRPLLALKTTSPPAP